MELDLEYYRRLLELEIGKLPRKHSKLTKDFINLELQYLNIAHSDLRKLKVEQIYLLSIEDQFKIYDYCFHTSSIFEVLSYILMELDKFSLTFLFEVKEDMLRLSYDIEHWVHSDLLSKIYSKMIEYKRSFLPHISEFALNGTTWQKRLSLTSLIYYSSQRLEPLQFELISHQIKLLLDEKQYYVQKGLGWTLRELYNIYPEKTLEFLEIYIKDISSIAFDSATQKIPKHKKEEFKNIRKSYESNPKEFEKKPAFENL